MAGQSHGRGHSQRSGHQLLLLGDNHLEGLVGLLLGLEEAFVGGGSLLLQGLHRAQAFLHDLPGLGELIGAVGNELQKDGLVNPPKKS